MSFRFSALITLIFIAAVAAIAATPPAPANLRVEYMTDPLGVDVARPRFSWVLDHPDRGQRQTAYQVLVSAKPGATAGDEWDSGRVESEDSTQVAYNGKPLRSASTYFWKVRYWDKNGVASPYSAASTFDTGLLNASDWKAQWIGGKTQLRREFTLPARPVRARAYISGLGYYELRVNGQKVGRSVLDPGWTRYDRRVLYAVHDLTPLLQSGSNAVGVMLGQGWYGSRALLLQVQVEMEGGKTFTLVSDTSWKARNGPVVSDSVYDGEVYDARLEAPGWDRPAFDETGWTPAEAVAGPKGVLSAQMMPAIEVTADILPLKHWTTQPGVYIFDMGQNFSGWAQLRVRGPRGASVRLRFAELLYEDGTLNVENLRRARATDVYILSGEGRELWEPRFTYHGFRYVEVSGLPEAPSGDTLRGRLVHTAVAPHGGFSASKQILNRLQHIITWGQKTNLHSIPTDCSQRDERMGWMGDAHVTAEPAMLNFDMAAFYTNFLRNIRDEQGEDGTLTDTVPHKWGSRPADPAWGAAYPLIAWYMYERYGDRRIVEEHYDGVRKWVDYMRKRSDNNLLNYSHYGDWVPILKTPGPVVSTFYYAYGAETVSRMAEVLGNKQDAASYGELAAAIRSSFHEKFFDASLNTYANGTQTANTLALFLGIPPKEKRGAVTGSLVNDIVYTRDTHITTGFLGIKYLMDLLPRIGRTDLAYELATQTTYPSWGYMIENGATTLWELWQNKTGPSMNSHNHPMFGSVGAFLYQTLGGINADPRGPGYRRIRIAPEPARDLKWVNASTETVRGAVVSSWSRVDGRFTLDVTVPVGSDAEIHLPKLNFASLIVNEGERAVWKDGAFQAGAAGITAGRDTPRAIVLDAGSGRYRFVVSEAAPSDANARVRQ